MRALIGQEAKGRTFKDRFLIADVRFKDAVDFPAERWFWFDPPFHPGQSVLLHKQPDGVWRIDFQLGWDADPDEEKKPERVSPRIKAMLGDDRPFELEWVSVYTFQCRRLDRFVHGRVLFVGDAAHQVSPFGARGANSGFQDTDNLCWKLARVLRHESPASLLDSYDDERVEAADENILNSTRATDFITPKSAISRIFRDAVLALSRQHPFARKLVNSGRLSTPTTYRASPLSTPDRDFIPGPMAPGAPAADAPMRRVGHACWLLDCIGGRFDLLLFDAADDALAALASALGDTVRVTRISTVARRSAGELHDAEGLAARVLEDDVDVLAAGELADALAEALPLLRVLGVLVLPELVALGVAVDDQLGAHRAHDVGLFRAADHADRVGDLLGQGFSGRRPPCQIREGVRVGFNGYPHHRDC